MPKQLGDLTRSAMADAYEVTIGTAPILQIRSDLPPANCAAADTGTLLDTINLPSDWLSAGAAGVKTLLGTWAANAVAAGLAGHYRIKNTAGSVCHEQGLCSQAWSASTAYLLNQQVNNGGNVYRCTTAGTSAGSGGPTGTGVGISDGTAVWAFVATGTDLVIDNTNIAPGQQITVTAFALTVGGA